METDKSEKKIKSLGFTLKIKENKKKEVKKNSLFDAKNFRKPFEEDIVYNDEVEVKEELIKEVEGRKIHAVHEVEKKGPLVIPLIKTNQWRNQDEIRNEESSKDEIKQDIDKKIEDKEPSPSILDKDQNEKEGEKEEEKEEGDDKIDLKSKYGLQIPVKKRKLNTEVDKAVEVTKLDSTENENVTIKDTRTLEEIAIDALKKEAQMDIDSRDHTKSNIAAIPILKQNAVPGTENLKTETEKFRYDIQFRPEESTLEDYERIPIEEFGAAMLRGMGWEKGKAVGRNRNNKSAMVEPIEFIPRPALLGLGAQPKPPDLEEMKKKRKRNMMGKEDPPKEYKPNVTSDGKVKHFRTLDEPRSSGRSSSRHRDSSRHSHQRHSSHRSDSDRDRERNRDRDRDKDRKRDKYKKQDSNNDDDSDSESSSSSSSKKESKYTHSSSYTQSRDHSRHRSSHSESGSGKRHHSSSSSRHDRDHSSSQSKPQNTWLYPNIRVRVVSKSYKSGKYYKKKGVVFDIARPGECTLRLDNGKLLEEVKERYLETLIPDVNENIIVVRHTPYAEEDYYQKVGKVLSKDRETEKAMVQMVSTMDVVNLSFDDICEFKGNTNDFY
ncbi:hypothetical protein PIROE2DRAFT_56889 [Piromyces sp. E2]|nr:hypothetical protein PIROE2DRAFT_56889 [Piromyces sp. E2]|eukprot:OUM70204.1 hypothetical protein PIROE2DRAFT_56889 [Piromyces sp. E2]